MRWCRNALSDGVVRAARHVGQGPLACPVLGTVRVAEAPGSRAAAGRRAAIAERPLGLEGRPGNLRGANHTITDVTGRGKAAPGHRWAALWPPTPRGSAALPTSDARKDRWVPAGRVLPGWSGTRCGSGFPAGELEFESASGEHGHGDERFG